MDYITDAYVSQSVSLWWKRIPKPEYNTPVVLPFIEASICAAYRSFPKSCLKSAISIWLAIHEVIGLSLIKRYIHITTTNSLWTNAVIWRHRTLLKLPYDTKPLLEPILKNHQWGVVIPESIGEHRKCSKYSSLSWVWKLLIGAYSLVSKGLDKIRCDTLYLVSATVNKKH